jgi:hypothetical protein
MGEVKSIAGADSVSSIQPGRRIPQAFSQLPHGIFAHRKSAAKLAALSAFIVVRGKQPAAD